MGLAVWVIWLSVLAVLAYVLTLFTEKRNKLGHITERDKKDWVLSNIYPTGLSTYTQGPTGSRTYHIYYVYVIGSSLILRCNSNSLKVTCSSVSGTVGCESNANWLGV